jgi:hypothetical protein
VLLILQIPGETFGAKVRFVLDSVADKILVRGGESLRLPTRGGPFWKTWESEALPYPLNGPWTGSLRPVLLLDLRCTPSGMALAECRELLFCRSG